MSRSTLMYEAKQSNEIINISSLSRENNRKVVGYLLPKKKNFKKIVAFSETTDKHLLRGSSIQLFIGRGESFNRCDMSYHWAEFGRLVGDDLRVTWLLFCIRSW